MPTTAARRPRYVPVVADVDTLRTHRLVFDSVTCSRCDGRGRLEAFAGVHGGVCFKCAGAKVQLTREGKAARARYVEAREALRVPVGDVVIGDRVEVHDRAGRTHWGTVDSVVQRDTDGSGAMDGKGHEHCAARELLAGVAYLTPLEGHPWHHAMPIGRPYPFVQYLSQVTIATTHRFRGEAVEQRLSMASVGTVVRHDADIIAAAWTAALSKRGATLVAR